MDMFNLLKQDHQKVQRMLEQLMNQSVDRNRPAIGDDLMLLNDELQLHMEIEEELLYPRARDVAEASSLIEESYQEHSKARDLMEELFHENAKAREWQSLLEELTTELNHHIRDEENKLFPILQKAWTHDEISLITSQIIERKQLQYTAKNLTS
jgi:iron-sulfur cluster repair protein YtfE (RIC family)